MADLMGLNVGFISTRFAGIDGVSLEASKWAQVFEGAGTLAFWFAGELTKSEASVYLHTGQISNMIKTSGSTINFSAFLKNLCNSPR